MPASKPYGRVLKGHEDEVRSSYERFSNQPIDCEQMDDDSGYEPKQTTLGKSVSVTGPGTFFGRAQRTLTFSPSREPGWQFDRKDLPECFPIDVTVKNVWPVPIVRNAVSSIVLLSGSPHNYMRMVEHIVALRVGMGVDNATIHMESGDPPLFDRGSLDLVEAFDQAGIVEQSAAPTYVTVREPVTVGGTNGSFLTLLPDEQGTKRVIVDCAIDFKTAIGKQHIRFLLNRAAFRTGAVARTNAPLWKMLFCATIGKLFADTRNLGYTLQNVLVAGPSRYINEPRLMHNGKSLEAVWHRATLDALAALALIERGRFCGTLISYKSTHTLDVDMIRKVYQNDLLVEV